MATTGTMTGSSFPYFADGDVKIVLSDNPQDTLNLHIGTLAKRSDFFKASLERIEWSHNKYIRKQGDVDTGVDMKLLELDLDGSDIFPLLMGATHEPSVERMKRQRLAYEESLNGLDVWNLAGGKYSSEVIVAAYKIGFALIYDLRIDLPSEVKDLKTSSQVIPAVVDFLDAYGLLPAYNSHVNAMVFGHKWSGYDIIGLHPFRMLQVACKLQSQIIFQEALRHAVGLHALYGCTTNDTLTFYSCTLLLDIGEAELHERVSKGAKELNSDLESLVRAFLTFTPQCCNKLGTARVVGLAIWRDWVINHMGIGPDHNHDGFKALAWKDYDVSDIIRDWASKDWDKEVGVRFGHVHRAVESCFRLAESRFRSTFNAGDAPRGMQLHAIDDQSFRPGEYISYLRFGADYEYPWAQIAALPSYTVPSMRTELPQNPGGADEY
ncbi:hypothetical protein LTR85_008258 [Meristemomyces frigidus]|nr:hypothetical protein LTR85_008258 [Meristemomyces frigidus]